MKILDAARPRELSGMIGQNIPIRKLMYCLKEGVSPIMVYGQTGTGKSLSLRLLAEEHDMELIEIDHLESKNSLERLFPAIKQKGLLGKKKVVVVDSAEKIRKNIISRILDESIFPVVLIVDSPYNPKFSALRRKCEVIEFKRISQNLIEDRLRMICDRQGLDINDITIQTIAGSSAGDLRAAIIDLETGLVIRDRENNIFETLRILFKSGDMRKAHEAIKNSEKDTETILRWVEENIANEFHDPHDRAKALEILSNADLYKRKTKRFVEMLAGITTVRPGKGFSRYRPAGMFFRKSADMSADISKEMHCSKKIVKREMPYMKLFLS